MRRATTLAPLVVVAALAGCGGPSPADDVAKAYDAFAHDVVHGDYAGACARMTGEARKDVEGAGRALTGGTTHTCGDALESTLQLLDQADLAALGKPIDASAVTVHGDDATVRANGNKAAFTRVHGAWLVAKEP